MPEETTETQPIPQGEKQPQKEWTFSVDGEYRMVDEDRLSALSQEAEVIIINDDHPSSFIHTDWVETIKELQQGGQKPSLLFEMIKDNYQDGLTDFVEGKMTEQDFRTQVYSNSWDWDYRRYSAYFRTARDLGMPAIAADLNKEEQEKYSNKDQPVETYAGIRYVSPRAHQRDLKMTAAIEQERNKGRKPILLVGGAHFGNQVNILSEQYGIAPEKILLLSEFVDGQHSEGFIEFKPEEGKPIRVNRLRPPEKR